MAVPPSNGNDPTYFNNNIKTNKYIVIEMKLQIFIRNYYELKELRVVVS